MNERKVHSQLRFIYAMKQAGTTGYTLPFGKTKHQQAKVLQLVIKNEIMVHKVDSRSTH
jgi:hypothetical protein